MRPPHRSVVAAILRSCLTVFAVLALYYLLPLDQQFGWHTVLELVAGIAFVLALVLFQLLAVTRSRYPALRAVQALSSTVPIFLLSFAAVYVIMSHSNVHSFTQPLTRTDSLYLVVTVFSTVGFGDITPVSESARVLMTVQMICDLAVLGVVFKSLLAAVRRSRDATEAPPLVAGHSSPEGPPGD